MWTRRRGVGCALAALVLGVGLPAAPPAPRAQSASLAGQLLVATPDLHDSHFQQAVVYMLRHDESGAMGLVVNQPLGDVPLARLLDQAGMDSAGAAGSIHLHVGGPVETARVFVLHTDDYAAPGTLRVGGGLALTWQAEILRALTAGAGPRRAVFALGYAGWGPGQLEGELRAGDWVSVPADEGIVFDDADATKWTRAFARRKISL